MHVTFCIHTDICSITSRVVFTTQKSIQRKSSCIHIYFTCRACQLNLHNSFHFETERIRSFLWMHTEYIHTMYNRYAKRFRRGSGYSKLNNNSTHIYSIGKCVGNPENLIIDQVNYENLHQSLQIDVLANLLLLLWI